MTRQDRPDDRDAPDAVDRDVSDRGDGSPDTDSNAGPDADADADLDSDLRTALDRAAATVEGGGLTVYPTETVYGLGADALDPAAVERLFEAKGRDRSKPVSLAAPDVDAALEYADPTPATERFMRAVLPGPVTVVCARRPAVPDVLTAGRDRVGIRVPDHPVALALLERTAPLTATSANLSGAGSARRVARIAPEVREDAAVVDAGETPGGGSTVVDVAAGEVIRRGEAADRVDRLLAEYAPD